MLDARAISCVAMMYLAIPTVRLIIAWCAYYIQMCTVNIFITSFRCMNSPIFLYELCNNTTSPLNHSIYRHTYTDINSDMNKKNLTSVHTLSVAGVDVLHVNT